jgi:hypothetical protein
MRTNVTLDEADIAEACDLLLAKRGMKRIGEVSISYQAAGADRPSDPESFSISVGAEPAKPLGAGYER